LLSPAQAFMPGVSATVPQWHRIQINDFKEVSVY